MYEDCVARGIVLLDQTMPGWEAHIDLDRLNLESSRSCILGQLYGDFSSGVSRIFGSYTGSYTCANFKRAVEHGFALGAGDILPRSLFARTVAFANLTYAWRDAIRVDRVLPVPLER